MSDRDRAIAESVLSTHTAPGSMRDKPALSQRTMSQLEDHAMVIERLEDELDRRADTIINLTKSLEFERDRRVR